MSNFVLKIIACICMFIGHIPFVFPDTVIPCILIGKISFPIFAFLISEGYVHTRDWKRYLVRLLIFSIISQIPANSLFNNDFSNLYFNIFYTLLFGLISIRIFDKVKNKFISFTSITFLAFIAELFGFDFGAIGVLMILFFYVFRERKNMMIVSQLILMFTLFGLKLYYYETLTSTIIQYVLLQLLFTVMSLVFIVLYNGKRGKNTPKSQFAFYFFYPLHLMFLFIIKSMI